MIKRFGTRGTTSDITTCDCCGKSDLKQTVIIVGLDEGGAETGDLRHYGSTCAAKALGLTHKAVKGASQSFKAQRDAAADWAMESSEAYQQWRTIHNTIIDEVDRMPRAGLDRYATVERLHEERGANALYAQARAIGEAAKAAFVAPL
jgi:hypothetical protein